MDQASLRSLLFPSELMKGRSGPAGAAVNRAPDPRSLPLSSSAGELLERLSLETRVHPEIRQAMSGLLGSLDTPPPLPTTSSPASARPRGLREDPRTPPTFSLPPAAAPAPPSAPVGATVPLSGSAPIPALDPRPLHHHFLPAFIALKGQILNDLEANLGRLLSLNVSRREAVAQYLDRLAGQPPAPNAAAGNPESVAGLRRWIEGPRSFAQNAALQAYFEEVALIMLGQAVLLNIEAAMLSQHRNPQSTTIHL